MLGSVKGQPIPPKVQRITALAIQVRRPLNPPKRASLFDGASKGTLLNQTDGAACVSWDAKVLRFIPTGPSRFGFIPWAGTLTLELYWRTNI